MLLLLRPVGVSTVDDTPAFYLLMMFLLCRRSGCVPAVDSVGCGSGSGWLRKFLARSDSYLTYTLFLAFPLLLKIPVEATICGISPIKYSVAGSISLMSPCCC